MNSRAWMWIVALSVGACASEDGNGGALPSDVGTGAGTTDPNGTVGGGGTGGGTAGTSSVTPPSSTNDPTMGPPVEDPIDPTQMPIGTPVANPVAGLPIPPECQGIDFNDIKYSPGGTALPNICEPFDATWNNPYAVQCINAWPWYKTNYPGDEYCILPPPPDQGLQFGMHPQGDPDVWFAQVSAGDMSGYENVAGEWTMLPGEEEERNYIGGTNNPQSFNFYRQNVRMRAGSHHMINSAQTSGTRGTWEPGSAAGLSSGTGLPGAQRPDENVPKGISKPVSDEGLYGVFPAAPTIHFNVHHFNSTPQTTLKEAWGNLWFETDARIQVRGIVGLSLLHPVLLSVAPGATRDEHYRFDVSQQIRIVTLFGHRHAWTPNFSAWNVKPDGTTEIVYQSFDWFDQPTYRYDSETINPTPAPELRADGGASGVYMVNPGDKLHFNCHITYTDERAALENAPSPASIGTLGFSNEAFTGEMCILFGTTAGVSLGMPVTDTSPLPSFATIE